jgi:hypothetical protein
MAGGRLSSHCRALPLLSSIAYEAEDWPAAADESDGAPRRAVQFPDFHATSRPEDQKVRIVVACMSVDETTRTGCESLAQHGFEEVGHMKESSRP